MSIAPASHTHRIYEALRSAILRGEFEPGEKIKIDLIRERFGVGASPVREALSLLTAEGLVERLDQRGFRASQISTEDFKDLLQTRSWLEERALREAIRHGDSAWEEAIVLAEYRMSKADSGTDAWEEAHREFHQRLIDACPSRYLLRFCERLYDRNIRYRSVARRISKPSRSVEKEHRAIMDSTLARDADAAVTALLAHYDATGRYVLERVARLTAAE